MLLARIGPVMSTGVLLSIRAKVGTMTTETPSIVLDAHAKAMVRMAYAKGYDVTMETENDIITITIKEK
jgi:hypothetical protein